MRGNEPSLFLPGEGPHDDPDPGEESEPETRGGRVRLAGFRSHARRRDQEVEGHRQVRQASSAHGAWFPPHLLRP